MLDITADDIAALNDSDLRTLVGLLCEAEVRSSGYSASAVTWGGNQDAGDGGIDVRVALRPEQAIEGFVPRAATGYQVKKPDMPPKEIIAEMKPEGKLRPSIQALADAGGAYLIVSSKGTVADKPLAERVKAMHKALEGASNANAIHLDFYDRNRIATWVRGHLGLIPRVRRAAGREIRGWRSYESWANPKLSTKHEFAIDEAGRVLTGSQDDGEGLTIVEGINRIRQVLASPGSSVRLVGLSGVGKTRVAQALFDSRIGEDALDPARAIYADEGDSPEPGPVGMIEGLIQDGTTAIVIIDNCRPEVHGRLSERCSGSQVSVMTIEYDIQDDQSEGTQTFKLEPSSVAITETVLKSRFPYLAQSDASRISEFSGGNFRLAFVLAETVGRNESVAKLSSRQLFERLFAQRQGNNPNLLQSAKACALVYSFDVGDTSSTSELAMLGSLVDQTSNVLYAAATEMKRRDLMQARSNWRAILPHAVANFLASLALEEIPYDQIERVIVKGSSERLLLSFAHRLSFLHEDPVAKKIAANWLATNGILAQPSTYGPMQAKLLFYIAPVAPRAALKLLQRDFLSDDLANLPDQDGLIRLLRSLAYDPSLFEEAAILLARLAVIDDEHNEASSAFKSLFYLYLSGTHATVEQRLTVLRGLVRSNNEKSQRLAKSGFAAMLEATHFTSSFDFDFGAHTRDYGSEPDAAGADHWFGQALKFATDEVRANSDFSHQAMSAVATSFRGLWTSAGSFDALEGFVAVVLERGSWSEGWLAVRQTLKYEYRLERDESYHRLNAIEQSLRPNRLVEQVRAIVFSTNSGGLYYDDFFDDDVHSPSSNDTPLGSNGVEEITVRLGAQVARDRDAFAELLPDMVSKTGHIFAFGIGIASGCEDPAACWEELRAAYAAANGVRRSASVLCGFLKGRLSVDAEMTELLLDGCVDDPVLFEDFPDLQCSVPVNESGVERLIKSLEFGRVNVQRFRVVAWNRNGLPVKNTSLARLVTAVAKRPGGTAVAIEIIYSRFAADNSAKSDHGPEVLEAGRSTLEALEFDSNPDRDQGTIGSVARICLEGLEGRKCAQALCARFSAAIKEESRTVRLFDELFQAICATHPMLVLDQFFSGDPAGQKKLSRAMGWNVKRNAKPLDHIPADVIIEWCKAGSSERFRAMATIVWMFQQTNDDHASSTWSSIASGLIEAAPAPGEIVEIFGRRIKPRVWRDSMAVILRGRLPLFEELLGNANTYVSQAAQQQIDELNREIQAYQELENQRDHDRDERFE